MISYLSREYALGEHRSCVRVAGFCHPVSSFAVLRLTSRAGENAAGEIVAKGWEGVAAEGISFFRISILNKKVF